METGSNGAMSSREVEVLAKGERRRFTAEYKLEVLREADNCKQSGEIGAVLRREGLDWGQATHWGDQDAPRVVGRVTAERHEPETKEGKNRCGGGAGIGEGGIP